MKKTRKLNVGLLAVVVLLMLYVPSVFASITIPGNTSIGTWDPVNRVYTLNTDVSESIEIHESNLTLDGAGHKVTGSAGGWICGLTLPGVTGVTVKGLTVEGFNCGIYLDTSSSNTVIGNTVTSNIHYGILLLHASNNTLADNLVNSNNDIGIGITYRSLNNTVTGNIVTGNGSHGVEFYYYSTGNILTGNTVSNNGTGIEFVYYSNNNSLTDNTIESNSGRGIYVGYLANNNNLTGNNVSNNRNGIGLYNSSNNILTDNTMSGNDYNFSVDGWSDAHFDHSVDTSNTVNGKPIYYIMNAANQVYDSEIAGAFFLIHCQNITITKSALAINRVEVTLWDTHYSTLENLTANWIKLGNSSNNILTGNTANTSVYGIDLNNSSDNTLIGNTANSSGYGIRLYKSSNNTLIGNTANLNRIYGIFINQSSGNTLTDNTANSNDEGIRLTENSNGSTLTDNTADSNNKYGISVIDSDSNTLTDNTVHSNDTGIWVASSDGNTLTDNTISNNVNRGVYLRLSDNNQIYNNNFISNRTQAYDWDGIGNVFNLAAPTGGNYWSDWRCPDADGDGFVDMPYIFPGGQDNLPLVPEGGCLNEFPVADAGPDQISVIGVTVIFDGGGSSDPDGHLVSQEWNFDDDTPTQIGEVVSHDYTTPGTYTVTLTVTDNDGGIGEDIAIVEVLSPGQAIEYLVTTIEDMNLQQGIDNSLDAKLQAIQDAIEAMNADIRNDAINKLEAFINAVEAQRGMALTDEQADLLVSLASNIISALY